MEFLSVEDPGSNLDPMVTTIWGQEEKWLVETSSGNLGYVVCAVTGEGPEGKWE